MRDVFGSYLPTASFNDGVAFCALFKLLKPDAVDLPALQKESPRVRLKLAFALWEQHYNIPQFLDADELVARPKADDRSVMTYVAMCLSVLERNRVMCPAAEGKERSDRLKNSMSSKSKFKFMSSALLPKTKAIESMDLSTSNLSLDFSAKRNSPRDSDSLRNNPLLSPRQSSAHLPRSPAGSPHSSRFRVPAIDARGASSNAADPRQVQTARALQPSETTPSFSPAALAKRDAHKLQEELDTQISKLSSIVESYRPVALKSSASSGSVTPSISKSASDTALAPPPTPAQGTSSTSLGAVAQSSSSMLLTDALEQIETVTLSLAPRTSQTSQAAAVTLSPAPSTSLLPAPTDASPPSTDPPPPVARPANYVPKDSASSVAQQPASVAATGTSATTLTAPTNVTSAPAPTATTTTATTSASSGTNLQPATAAKVSSFALVSSAEFSQMVGSATNAVSSAAKTFIGDLRGRSGAADLRNVSSLRPLIVVVVRETGSLLSAMDDGRETRELVAVVKSFITAGYQLTAALARDTESAALKDSLQTVVCHIKLLLRSLAWLNEA